MRRSPRGFTTFAVLSLLVLHTADVRAQEAALLGPLVVARLPADARMQETVDLCLGCHETMEGESVSFPDGSTLPLVVEYDAWTNSVHGGELSCTDCHRDIVDFPHPELYFENARAYQLAQAETCNRCHYAYYTRVLDSIHYAQLEAGVTQAPTCTDCHGAHDVTDPDHPRIQIDRRCARCHGQIAEAYERSVHGQALLDEDNQDVPVCTDCHGAHAISDPRLMSFHVSSYTLCAQCHGDAERMAPYGLNPDVLTTYLEDFHGVSNRLYAAGAGTPDRPMATCTDCHGVHDIQPFAAEEGREAVRARVATMCRNCHGEVPEGFADAWLYHYTPTLQSAPLIWLIKWFYRIAIPLIMAGLVLHILLHLWRVRTHR